MRSRQSRNAAASPASASSTALRVSASASPSSSNSAARLGLSRQPRGLPRGLPEAPFANGRPRARPGCFCCFISARSVIDGFLE
jgi:hypothetical protein